MCSIFHWLKSRKVKSVMSVTVVDDVEPSHSDEAIEACVNTLDVRTWNWYKVDLCCSVLINSAPHVRDVTLYSSGNNAVLMGWSSRDGLAMLEQVCTFISSQKLETYDDVLCYSFKACTFMSRR